ncbi:PIN domain-containing protein [Mycobacterium sp. NPDC050441]|uniref:PIN domain-containing protein n=1 Tax=Mycobacterium sp. NPDC050441 TaxID=3155403 RepID=UPI0033FB017F
MSMKSVLPEWYGHDDDTLSEILRNGTIALDTNALLDLYRVGKQQRTEILGVLAAFSDRLFIPYQVALEFQRSRLNVVRDNGAIYDKLAGVFDLKQEQLNGIRDPQLRAEVESLFNEVSKPFKHRLDHLRSEHALTVEAAKKSDPVLDALDDLLTEGSVGARPSDQTLKDRRATATRRIADKIPPGFADAKNKDDPSGDYLIWAELLEHAAKSSRPLIFVSNDDTKGDWYRARISGHSLGPLPELVAEMYTAMPDHPYHQTNLASFLSLTKQHLGLSVGEETIDTVERIEVYNPPTAADIGRAMGEDAALLALGQRAVHDPKLFAVLRHRLDEGSDLEWQLAEALAAQPQPEINRNPPDLADWWPVRSPAEWVRVIRRYPTVSDIDTEPDPP